MSEPEPWARAGAVAGLARELDGLRRQVDAMPGEIAGLSEQVDALTRMVSQLTDTIAVAVAAPRRPAPLAAESWLAAPLHDPGALDGVLGELCAWLTAVFLRYADARDLLPACWLWHPDVVEELCWLFRAWSLAYQSENASVTLAGDWHDRQRPGVVRRLKTAVGSCSPERHHPRPDTRTNGGGPGENPAAPPRVPGMDGVATIVGWWAHARTQTPTPPPADTTSWGPR